jgi:hypothetical protein
MPPSVNAQLVDKAAAHAINLLRFDSHTRASVLGYLRRLQDVLERRLRDFRFDVASPSIRRLRLEQLKRTVDEAIATAYGSMADALDDALTDVAGVASRVAGSWINGPAIAAEIELVTLTLNQLKALASNVLIEGAPSALWWEAQAGDLRQRFADAVTEGLGLGETTDDLVRRIRGTATGRRNTYEINGRQYTYVEFRGGIMDTSTRNARSLVRTSVQTVASTARRETFLENQDVVKGVVQVSTLDTRTTVTCIAYGGKAWSLPDYEPIDHDLPYNGGTPRHWGCRSTEAPLLRSWDELGIDLDEVAGGAGRWSRLDGEVPADISMDAFLNRRTDAQVDEMLGPGVADLWRSGAVSLEDLIDRQTGRPLSLADLEAA